MKSTQPSQYPPQPVSDILLTLNHHDRRTIGSHRQSSPHLQRQVHRFPTGWIVYRIGGYHEGCLDGTNDGDTCGLRRRSPWRMPGASSRSYYIYFKHRHLYTYHVRVRDDVNALGDLDIYGATVYIQGHGVNDTIITQSGTFDRIIDHQGDHNLTPDQPDHPGRQPANRAGWRWRITKPRYWQTVTVRCQAFKNNTC